MRQLRLLPFLTVLMLLFIGCTTRSALMAENLGGIAYTMKTLDGLFYSYEEELYLLSGTEVSAGTSNHVFLYNVNQDKLVMSQTLSGGSCSMTAFCDAGNMLYFATISSSASYGCDLYVCDKSTGEVRACAHLENVKGIYDLAWDGKAEIFVATAYPAALYGYHTGSGETREVCTGFTDQNYVRSLSYVDGFCYLGVGAVADFIMVDTVSGACRSLLPKEYVNESFVYEQASSGSKIALLLSPSCRILEYDTQTGIFTDTGFFHQEASASPADRFSPPILSGNERFADLLGELLLMDETGISGAYESGGKAAYLDAEADVIHALSLSGIYTRMDLAGNLLFQRDLSELLEPKYIKPPGFQVWDGTMYVPWRRFVVRDSEGERAFLVKDEPQASTVTADGIYTANYSVCRVYFYPFSTFRQDPADVSMNDESFLLADIENQCRPRQMIVTPDGRYLVLGSGPLYGHFGGAVSVIDLETGALLYTHENVVEGHQILSVAPSEATPGAVWLGTFTYGENSAPVRVEGPAHLILWDIEEERILLDIVPNENDIRIFTIAERDGRVYTYANGLRSYDALTGEALETNLESEKLTLQLLSDGRLWGFSNNAIYSIDPNRLNTTVLIDGFSALSHLTEDPVTGELYIFEGTDLLRLELTESRIWQFRHKED